MQIRYFYVHHRDGTILFMTKDGKFIEIKSVDDIEKLYPITTTHWKDMDKEREGALDKAMLFFGFRNTFRSIKTIWRNQLIHYVTHKVSDPVRAKWMVDVRPMDDHDAGALTIRTRSPFISWDSWDGSDEPEDPRLAEIESFVFDFFCYEFKEIKKLTNDFMVNLMKAKMTAEEIEERHREYVENRGEVPDCYV